MQDAIQRFTAAADNFGQIYRDYRDQGGVANCTAQPPRGSVAFALLLTLHQARRELQDAGQGLAEMLVGNGHDGRALLRFCNAIREADFETAIPLWPALKAELQQVAIVAGLPPEGQDDDSVWILVSKLEPPRIPNMKERQRYLDRHREEIRTRRPPTKQGTPNPRRLEVHIGDWIRHWSKVDAQTFDNIDGTGAAPITPDELTEDFMDGAAKLYGKVFQGKRPRE
jgi:hypothetical protein